MGIDIAHIALLAGMSYRGTYKVRINRIKQKHSESNTVKPDQTLANTFPISLFNRFLAVIVDFLLTH